MATEEDIDELRRRVERLEAVVRAHESVLKEMQASASSARPERTTKSTSKSTEPIFEWDDKDKDVQAWDLTGIPPNISVQQEFGQLELRVSPRVIPIRDNRLPWMLLLFLPPLIFFFTGIILRMIGGLAVLLVLLAPVWFGATLMALRIRRTRQPRLTLTAQHLIWNVFEEKRVHLDEITRIFSRGKSKHRILIVADGEEHRIVEGLNEQERDWLTAQLEEVLALRRASLRRDGHDLDQPAVVPPALQKLRQPQG